MLLSVLGSVVTFSLAITPFFLLVFQYFQVRPNLIYFILPKESPVVLQFSLFTLVRSSMLILQHYSLVVSLCIKLLFLWDTACKICNLYKK